MVIEDLLSRDLDQRIEEVIKVDQTDEDAVYREIEEYVATSHIRDHYEKLLRVIAGAPQEPAEAVGIWISGFFGSGKSSFAKNLAYMLSNRMVRGQPANALYKRQLNDPVIGDLLDSINARIPTDVVMFDIRVDHGVQKDTERVAEVMYHALLRELDYAQDFAIAELEIEMEQEGRLEEFTTRCEERYGKWRMVRKGAQKLNRASAILHDMDPGTYKAEDSWARAQGPRPIDITVGQFVTRTFDLMERRRPGRALAFVMDEIGAYVARSEDKIEDLRAVVEQFGKESCNRVRARKAVAPVWVAVTSQERLDDIVAAIDSKRVELARLRDRFPQRQVVDLAPTDIREVATRRVLAKKPEGERTLRELYRRSQGLLNNACRLHRSGTQEDITEDDFVQFYPYLPHYVELSIDIVSGIRLQPGANRQAGGSNRTIIKQAYEMLVSPKTCLRQAPVGRLVTLDRIYDLIEGSLSNERQHDISDIRRRTAGAGAGDWPVRVGKAICLLEFVRDLARTEENLAACLVDEVGQPAPLAEVKAALDVLEQAQFVRHAETGWKLQTAQEKTWATERQAIAPNPRERNAILHEVLRGVFSQAGLRNYRYKDLRTFNVGMAPEGEWPADRGQLPLAVFAAYAGEDLARVLDEVRTRSRQEAREIQWVYACTLEIDGLVDDIYRSGQMVARYDQAKAHNEITNEQANCLHEERQAGATLARRLSDRLEAALCGGSGFFQGVQRDGANLGSGLVEILRALLEYATPMLYEKLEMGARPLKGNEAGEILAAANLAGLPAIFHTGDKGLGLVASRGQDYVVNVEAPIAREVLGYLASQQDYGERERLTGKALESQFGGFGYGWERDMLRLVLAALFRASAIEVTCQGQRFDSYTDRHSHEPFTSNTAFKTATFTPLKPIDIGALVAAVKSYEALTGASVDVDAGAIAGALRKLADAEMGLLIPLQATCQARSLPASEMLDEYRKTLENIQKNSKEGCVKLLASGGAELRDQKRQVRVLREAVAGGAADLLDRARAALKQMWPVLERWPECPEDLAGQAEALADQVESALFFEHLDAIQMATGAIADAYTALYREKHSQRTREFRAAIDAVRNRPEWPALAEEARPALLQQLTMRACEATPTDGTVVCSGCLATVPQLESDMLAAAILRDNAIGRLKDLTRPEAPPRGPTGLGEGGGARVVRLADFFAEPLESPETIRQACQALETCLLDLLDEGVSVEVE